MNEMQNFMHNAFWVPNQVSFTFASPVDPEAPLEEIVKSLNLSDLAAFLSDHGFTLRPLDVPGSDSAGQPADADLRAQLSTDKYPGIYVFPIRGFTPDALPSSLVPTFFRFEAPPAAPQGADYASQQEQQANQGPVDLSSNTVTQIVNLVNGNLDKLSKGGVILEKDGGPLGPIPIKAAAPIWYCGASGVFKPYDQVATGCPLTPPLPVTAEEKCASSPGLWPIKLPELPPELEKMSGDGVTVFVLDSLPSESDIRRAAEAAGEHNLLLLDLINNVTFTYPALPDIIDRPGPQQPVTGKDIKGRAVGFRMPDHGLFVAGIIRDIAPSSRLECIRVLNDYCTGTVQTITEQLSGILQRTAKGGDLYGRDVVINMSLVIADDEDLQTSRIDLALARLGLGEVLQSLSESGVIFIASAGNEGDRRYNMGSKQEHPDALYPAAYADRGVDSMIPVGAVNRKEEITSYSCYPGRRGVSTYGGEVPADSAIFENPTTHMTDVDRRTIDAVIGVYTQLSYPALSFDDREATYPAPNARGWAYWIGTSFATPIISAVVARALELRRRKSGLEMQDTDAIIRYATKRQVSWPVSSGESSTPIPGPVIWASQCHPLKENGFISHMKEAAEHFTAT